MGDLRQKPMRRKSLKAVDRDKRLGRGEAARPQPQRGQV